MFRLSLAAISTSLLIAACSPGPQTDETPALAPAVPETEDTSEADLTPIVDPNPQPSLAEELQIETIGYPDGWVLQPFWSGEYPNAFSVTQEGVTVMGHETITFEEYPPIYCGLPHKATYSPWNSARRESDSLEFVAMVYPTTVTLQEDVSLQALIGDGEEQLDLKAGDQLIYKSYLAEGFFIAEKDGIQYELNEGDLPQSTVFEQGPEDQEWVHVTCTDADQTRAWIRFEDALSAQGVERYEYTGFAVAEDLP
ncbi:MAG: hypothetical protein NXH72_10860 [Hyphomonadaceae bacterium]|nr:hypothetical protein [Hyphomonadaceae bacterium]